MVYKTGNDMVAIEFIGHKVKDDYGRELAVIYSGRDISRVKQMMERLKTEARLLDNLKAVIIACDMQGRIIYANNSCLDEIGYQLSDIFGTRLIPGIVPMDLGLRNKFKKELSQKGRWDGIVQLIRKDGVQLEIEGTIIRLVERTGYFIADVVMIPF